MAKRTLSYLANWTLSHHRAVLALGLAITLGLGFFMVRLRLVSDLTSLLPPSFESVQNLKKLKDEFSRGGQMMGLIEGPYDVSIRFLDEINESLLKIPDVDSVDYQKPLGFFMKHGALYLTEADLREILDRVRTAKKALRQGAGPVFDPFLSFYREEENPFDFDDIQKKYTQRGLLPAHPTEPYYVNDEKNAAVFLVRSRIQMFQPDTARAFIARVRAASDHVLKGNPAYSGLKVRLTGDLVNYVEETQRFQREVVRVAVLVILLIGILIFFWYGRFYSLLVITVPLVFGLVWTGALTYLLIGHINLVTSFTSGVLMGLGSDYGIYLLSRYLKESGEGASFEKALVHTMTRTSRALVSACLTTIAVFVVIALPDFRGFSEFGVIGAVGVGTNLLLYFFVFPALLVECQLRGWLEAKKTLRPPLFSRIKWIPFFFSLRASTVVVLVFLLLTGISAYAGRDRLVLEHDLNKFQDYWPELPSLKWQEKASEILGPGFKPTVIIAENGAEEKRLIDSLRERINSQGSDRVIHDVVSLASLVPEGQERKIPLIRDIQRELKSLSPRYQHEASFFLSQVATGVSEADIPPEIKRLFLASDPSATQRLVLVHPAIKRDNASAIEKFAGVLRALPAGEGKTVSASGEFLVLADILQLINREGVHVLAGSLLVLFLIVLLDLKDWLATFGVMTSLVTGLVLTIGLMKVCDIRFNIFNIALIPVILGTEIDCFLHFYHYHTEEENRDPWKTLHLMGPPITLSCLTTLIGFGGFILTGNAGLRSIGFLSLVAIVSIYATCIVFYPALITLLERLTVRRYQSVEKLEPQGVAD